MDELLSLWDFFFAYGDPFFAHYYGLAYILDKKYGPKVPF